MTLGRGAAALAVAAAANPSDDASASRLVDTDAMRIHANSSISVPADVRLTCDATPGTQRTSSGGGDYTTTPASIVLTDPTISIMIPDDGGVPGDNAEFDHCIVLTTGNSGNINLNPTDIVAAMQDIRNMVANHSTAIVCTAATCNIHHNLIVGFDAHFGTPIRARA